VQHILKVVAAARRDPEWNKDIERPVEREPHL